MAVRPVLALPDPFLQRPSATVGTVDDAALALAADLLDTMRSRPACVGLAAPQIGVGLRAFAIDVTGHRKARSCAGELVLFDPELVSSADEPVMGREGCLEHPRPHRRRGPGHRGRGAGHGGRRHRAGASRPTPSRPAPCCTSSTTSTGSSSSTGWRRPHSVYRRKVYR